MYLHIYYCYILLKYYIFIIINFELLKTAFDEGDNLIISAHE